VNIGRLADSQAKDTWIGELVKCACSHGIGRHSGTGCEGDFRGVCRCRRTRAAVMEFAVCEEFGMGNVWGLIDDV
jgi:hypothetical protein